MSKLPAPALVFTIHAENGEELACYRLASGVFGCPVCGHPLAAPAYAPRSSEPSFTWCPCCECQFGWDDRVGPGALPGSKLERWAELRREWNLWGTPCTEPHLPPATAASPGGT